MQVSIETLSSLERKMTIAIPPEQVESQVEARLQEAARTVAIKGFRKGKVPLKVIRERYGKGVRQEVLGEVMSQSYYDALGQEKVRPAGQPRITPKSWESGKELEFEAYFEVYPEVKLGDFAAISVERKVADIGESDIDNMIETLRKQRQTWKDSAEAARDGDQVTIDFTGTLDGAAFEGGSAKGVKLVLGSKRMIDGFEAGLVGAKASEARTLDLSFPADYHKADLAGKAVQFAVSVTQVEAVELPELNDTFFKSFDIKEGGLDAFRREVKNNMARELKNAVRNNLRNQVVDGLVKTHSVELPKALVAGEIHTLRQQAVQQYGNRGASIDGNMLPDELFRAQAERRVSLGLIMSEVIQAKALKVDSAKVRTLVEEMAESYERPQDVINWYYSNKDQLAQVEAMALEEAVIDQVLEAASITETPCSYEDALKPSAAPQPSAG
ncbi:MAG: trigger factor [Pseudomonadales bacterium]|jgi:trigger factor|nr:trigger factor [Pseudomonadales bacterium]